MKLNIWLRTEVLADHIARRNLSHAEFARQAGLSIGYFSQIMRGHRNIGQLARQKILKATQTPPNRTTLDFDQLFEIHVPSTQSPKAPNAALPNETATETPSGEEVIKPCQI